MLAQYANMPATSSHREFAAAAALSPDLPRTVVDDGALAHRILSAWNACQSAVTSGNKESIRDLHVQAKGHDRAVAYADLRRLYIRHRRYFPQPAAITPSKIQPILVPVASRSLESDLFRIARGSWSMPFSKGYGRRLRFLVMDQHHQALIGIIGLQSPPADLACRDAHFGVDKASKLAVVNNTLDAFTVGATPAYAPLIAGKLVAGLLCSHGIRQAYWRAYGGKLTTQRSERIPQPLLAITTASAFGRSSLYNRLRLGNRLLAKPLGYTKGFGTIHLEHLYPLMVDWLRSVGQPVVTGFGHGPKSRWQNVMRALQGLSVQRECLEHGIQRQVFVFELVKNFEAVCKLGTTADPIQFSDVEWFEHWQERWCGPRTLRNPDWYEFDSNARFERAFTFI